VPPPLDLKLGLPATQTINMQRQETTARTTQPGSQNTTSTQQRKITVSTSVANGLGTHVFQVELGHDVAAIDTQTNKHVTIDKGTLVSIFQQETLFHPFFILVHGGATYRILQTEVNDGVIRNISALRKP